MKDDAKPIQENGVPQEHTMGCAVSCVAYRANLNYQEALSFFRKPEHAWTRGFYCSEIVEALAQIGLQYDYAKFNSRKFDKKYLQKEGTIVFVAPFEEYPYGHFFVQSKNGWMNPWSNYPQIKNVKSDFQKHLPGSILYIVFEIE